MAKAGKTKRRMGRPPGGEYLQKSEVANFRIRPDTKRLLAASGRTFSQECEHQLRRALVDMGAGGVAYDPSEDRRHRSSHDPPCTTRPIESAA